jgi:hypothetical protein
MAEPIRSMPPNDGGHPRIIQVAEAELDKVFDFQKATTVEAKSALAKSMLSAALESDDTPALQFVMLQRFWDLSAIHGDLHAAEKAIWEINQRFEVDELAMRGEAITKSLAATLLPPLRREITATACAWLKS